jgi:hypothetical protein
MAEDDGSAETLNLIVVVEEAPSAPSYVSVEAPPEAPPYVSVDEVVTRMMHVFDIDKPAACMEFLYQQQNEAGVDFEGKRSPHSPWEKVTLDYWLACEYVDGGFWFGPRYVYFDPRTQRGGVERSVRWVCLRARTRDVDMRWPLPQKKRHAGRKSPPAWGLIQPKAFEWLEDNGTPVQSGDGELAKFEKYLQGQLAQHNAYPDESTIRRNAKQFIAQFVAAKSGLKP